MHSMCVYVYIIHTHTHIYNYALDLVKMKLTFINNNFLANYDFKK